MPRAILQVSNSRSQIGGLQPEVLHLLRYELSYPVAEPGTRLYPQSDGSVKAVHWDGYSRLLTRAGTFPSGLVPRALRLLAKWGVGVEVRDLRRRPPEAVPRWSFPWGFELRDYQLEACDAAERMGRGVFDSPPRTGKTIMLAEMLRRIADTTVVTAPTVPIAEQTHAKLLELLALHGEGWSDGKPAWDFYLMTGGPPKSFRAKREAARAVVYVCTAETAVAMSKDWWSKVRCLAVDERHHQAALKTYGKLNDLATNAYFRYGFTGTNFRSRPAEQVALEACLGRTCVRYSIADMRRRGVLVAARAEFRTFEASQIPASTKFEKVYPRGIVRCEPRNQQIALAAAELQARGRKVLVLVQRIEHGERLAALIRGSRFVQSSDGPDVRQAIAELDRGELTCVIGSPVVGEGLDIPTADALIYAKARKARVTHTQDTFRVLTAGGAKRDAVIVDFVDRHNVKLLDHAVERMKNYVAMGLQVGIDNQGGARSQSRQLGFGPGGGGSQVKLI